MYILEISCSPGGCRKGDYYVRTHIDEIWDNLREDLASDPYILLWYGEKIKLYQVSEYGIEILDLHNYISVTWRDQVYDTNKGGIIGYEFSDGYIDTTEDGYDYIQNEDESSMLFSTEGGEIQGNNIVFSDIPLVIHLDLPELDMVSEYPVSDVHRLPMEIGYHNTE